MQHEDKQQQEQTTTKPTATTTTTESAAEAGEAKDLPKDVQSKCYIASDVRTLPLPLPTATPTTTTTITTTAAITTTTTTTTTATIAITTTANITTDTSTTTTTTTTTTTSAPAASLASSAAIGCAKQSKEPNVIVYSSSVFCQRQRGAWISTERINELRRAAQEAVRHNRTFTIRGCFQSVRHALLARGWVEKLDMHRKQSPSGVCQVTYEDIAQMMPKRRSGETRRAYISKCERNIISRFLEHMPIDFLWTNRKEKCDYIDQAKNPTMIINKFHRVPFTTKEGLCNQLRDFHWFYEEGMAEAYFPRCYNVWSPEELNEFIDNFKLTACVAFMRLLCDRYRECGFEAVFSPSGKVPLSAIDFAFKRCTEYIESCDHADIDLEPPKTWEHDWDVFLGQHQLAIDGARLLTDSHRLAEGVMASGQALLDNLVTYWPQYSLDGYRNLWIVKPANKCRGRGIQLMDSMKKIIALVNPPTASKSRYVVQKYIERPLIIHHTKFDIRQWFLITNVQPLVLWMYKESYLRFSSQPYSLNNHHESVHLTNHAIQKKYTNGQGRDKRLPTENMWDCYSFQAFLRQIGKHHMWLERIYPGMRKAIVGTVLASQENMDRRPNTFELFGADFMICEDFHPWLIEINSSPDLGATTSVTARMCPQCLEDVIKVTIDRRSDPKADLGNFELIYRQSIPATPAYMGLNLFVKGKQITNNTPNGRSHHPPQYAYHRRERSLSTSNFYRHRTALTPPTISNVHRIMPIFNATEFIERSMIASETLNSSRSGVSALSAVSGSIGSSNNMASMRQFSPLLAATAAAGAIANNYHGSQSQRTLAACAPPPPPPPPPVALNCPNLLKATQSMQQLQRKSLRLNNTMKLRLKSTTNSSKASETIVHPLIKAEVNRSPSKRHRSCGPRLHGASSVHNLGTSNADHDKKFKFIIKKWTVQRQASNGEQTAALTPTTTSASLTNNNDSSATAAASLKVTLHRRSGTPNTALLVDANVPSHSPVEKREKTQPCSPKTLALQQFRLRDRCRRKRSDVQAIVGHGLSSWKSSYQIKQHTKDDLLSRQTLPPRHLSAPSVKA